MREGGRAGERGREGDEREGGRVSKREEGRERVRECGRAGERGTEGDEREGG